MKIILIRLEAPLISFGAPIVDRYGTVQPYPAQSMITGMVGNALGYSHGDTDALERLQKRLQYASRRDRTGTRKQDYQTVDLGSDYMDDDLAWTTRGELQTRKGGSASSGTHIRLRDYWADAAHTVALTLSPAGESPSFDTVADALQQPERPLFIGRKTCLPSRPMYLGRMAAESLVEALRRAPLADDADSEEQLDAWWPANEPGADGALPVTDERDWENQIHVGERWIASGKIDITPEEVSYV
ncbi:MAG: type I-E CRISPR-associated protein Cas5/CasD [Planctomycetota bacterium]